MGIKGVYDDVSILYQDTGSIGCQQRGLKETINEVEGEDKKQGQ